MAANWPLHQRWRAFDACLARNDLAHRGQMDFSAIVDTAFAGHRQAMVGRGGPSERRQNDARPCDAGQDQMINVVTSKDEFRL
jgi:hypothetical protein